MGQVHELEVGPRKIEEPVKINPTITIIPLSAGIFNSIRALNEHRDTAAKLTEKKISPSH